jgi:flagellar basal-body rod protein FlgB
VSSLLDIASHQARWLALSQAVTAQNIANVSTPGYRAKEVAAFDDVLARASSGGVQSQSPLHEDAANWAVRPSGNSVTLEEELIRAGGITRAHSVNVGIVSAFHRLHMAAIRG